MTESAVAMSIQHDAGFCSDTLTVFIKEYAPAGYKRYVHPAASGMADLVTATEDLDVSDDWNDRYDNYTARNIRGGYAPYSRGDFKIEAGIGVRTTIMLRNIPNRVNFEDLKLFQDATSEGHYDFPYLRIDFSNKLNVGYAFINFIRPEFIINLVRQRPTTTSSSTFLTTSTSSLNFNLKVFVSIKPILASSTQYLFLEKSRSPLCAAAEASTAVALITARGLLLCCGEEDLSKLPASSLGRMTKTDSTVSVSVLKETIRSGLDAKIEVFVKERIEKAVDETLTKAVLHAELEMKGSSTRAAVVKDLENHMPLRSRQSEDFGNLLESAAIDAGEDDLGAEVEAEGNSGYHTKDDLVEDLADAGSPFTSILVFAHILDDKVGELVKQIVKTLEAELPAEADIHEIEEDIVKMADKMEDIKEEG
ncbi:unnamed protein product [Aureobasidium vineae]|uniref:Mei2-like C-terminal RNA recognition motif domain-containing protein n=1 Tax=Aureobasidium vineae TaxID=2773715 RepID=A0A9N8JTT5_9PEZI|nr:unnamed protein product [Aureobasidium vineae]